MPRGQGKVKRKRGKIEPSGAWESEKRQTCPAGREKRRGKEGKQSRAGHGRVKRSNHAPQAGKNCEKRRKTRTDRQEKKEK